MSNITDLNKEQQRAFNRLKRAYKDCKKLGVFFVNRYGSLYAYDSALICGFGDNDIHANGVTEIPVSDTYSGNYFIITNEWADDESDHYCGLTEKGRKLYFDED